MKRIARPSRLVPLAILLAFVLVKAGAQQFQKYERDRGLQMLHDVADAVRKHYYDPAFHGIDLNAKVKQAEEVIRAANSNSDIFGAIAGVLDPLDDSHTFFEPPTRSAQREFGFVMAMAGDRCFITNVRPRTDASEKLAPGDQVLAINGTAPARANLWKINYAINALFAPTALRLRVARPDGSTRDVDVAARIRQDKRVLDLTSEDFWQVVRQDENSEHQLRQRQAEFGNALTIWKMPEFDMTDDELDHALSSVKRRQALILDLRDNPGGAVKTLQYLISGFFDHDVTIATRKGRKPDLKPMVAKKHGSPYKGKLIVLVDSRSASAAEVFARTVQLEHRGTVIGDVSSGSVMESQLFSLDLGAETKVLYGVSVADADLIMSDGKSLEHVGVTPDQMVLITAQDLAAGRDPVLSAAAKLAGMDLDPVQAGKLFPYEWNQN